MIRFTPTARTVLRVAAAVSAAAALAACTTPAPHDYSEFLDHTPRSILVLPPLNESPDVLAPYVYLSTVTRPLAERGYYVFPVALVDAFLKENGLPTPGEMHAISLGKIREVFGADAVLYVTVNRWGTSYVVIDSVTVVSVTGRLVDVGTGTVLWSGTQSLRQSASDGSGNPIAMAIAALLNQVVSSLTDPAHDLSEQANAMWIGNTRDGFLPGTRHPDYEAERERRKAEWQEYLRRKAEEQGKPPESSTEANR